MSTSDTSPSANRRGSDSWSRSHLSINRRGRGYSRVTFDHPPINRSTSVAEISELVGPIESGCAGVASSIAVMVGEQVVANRSSSSSSASVLGDQLDERRNQLRTTLPIGRVVGPADVAALAVHLMTNTALTGATYDIDGGQQLV